MRVPLFINCIAITFALSVPTFTNGQISEQDKKTAIQTIARHIAENYVDQAKGGQISSHILMANHKGEFKKTDSWEEFDAQVTKSIQKFSGDGHLYVKYNPEIVKGLQTTQADSQQMNTGEKPNENNYGFTETKIVGDNIGYIKLSEINLTKQSLPALYSTMEKVANTNALIIDLRDNGGGGSNIGAVLESYFLPAGTPLLEFMSRSGTQTIDSTVDWLDKKKYDKPVYILTNRKTASAAEAFAFVMQNQKRAKIVGETSAGAANRNSWFAINNENYLSVSTAATFLPGTQISWEQEGVQPDVKVKNGDPLEYVLSKLVKG
jgi:C-terminal processing protease CtpA/Prc